MKLIVKDMDIATGGIQVVILHQEDARLLDLHHMDRVVVSKGKKKAVATVDIGESKKAVRPGHIGLFEEMLSAINAKHGDTVKISFAEKPQSFTYIKKKMDGGRLTPKEMRTIIDDIVKDKLTDIELTSYVVASYTQGMSMKEVASMTKAMAETGDMLKLKHKTVVDLHSIGGVPGNRTTMLMVPLLVAAGCIVPKTSSRAITSPAGTADTMEVLCSVSLPMKDLKKVVSKVGGFIIWGGAVNLAPADDKIIQIEHPLNIDAEGQMVASIMAKKASVGATHLLLELPIGKGAKVPNKKEAKHLGRHFAEIGNKLGIKVKNVITPGTKPIGKGIGPVLEARDVLWALRGDKRAPKDLIEKSLELTGTLLEFSKKAKSGKGKQVAKQLLEDGSALDAFESIVKAQHGKLPKPGSLKPASKSYTIKAKKPGKFEVCCNGIARSARLAGAPVDKKAGLYLHNYVGSKVKKGQDLVTIYASSKRKLKYAMEALNKSVSVR